MIEDLEEDWALVRPNRIPSEETPIEGPSVWVTFSHKSIEYLPRIRVAIPTIPDPVRTGKTDPLQIHRFLVFKVRVPLGKLFKADTLNLYLTETGPTLIAIADSFRMPIFEVRPFDTLHFVVGSPGHLYVLHYFGDTEPKWDMYPWRDHGVIRDHNPPPGYILQVGANGLSEWVPGPDRSVESIGWTS